MIKKWISNWLCETRHLVPIITACSSGFGPRTPANCEYVIRSLKCLHCGTQTQLKTVETEEFGRSESWHLRSPSSESSKAPWFLSILLLRCCCNGGGGGGRHRGRGRDKDGGDSKICFRRIDFHIMPLIGNGNCLTDRIHVFADVWKRMTARFGNVLNKLTFWLPWLTFLKTAYKRTYRITRYIMWASKNIQATWLELGSGIRFIAKAHYGLVSTWIATQLIRW